jgi:hypothetical protein
MREMEHFEKRERGTNRGKDSEGEGLKGQSVMVQGTRRLACSLDILRKHPRAQSTLCTRHSRMSLSTGSQPAEASTLNTADLNSGSAAEACSAPAPGKPCGRTRFCALAPSLTHADLLGEFCLNIFYSFC